MLLVTSSDGTGVCPSNRLSRSQRHTGACPASITNMSQSNPRINNFVYEACRRWVESVAEPTPQLDALCATAFLAWMYRPGRFADGALENCALRHGSER